MAHKQIGEILRSTRMKRGLSLYALGEQSGVDRGLLLRIERGDVSNPKPENLLKVAKALGISLTDIYAQAGYVTGTRLPTMPAYLRAKYGYLPPEKQQEVVDFLKEIERQYGRSRDSSGTRSKRGGNDGNDSE